MTPPNFPIIVGVTGHRDFAAGTEPALTKAVTDTLAALKIEFGDALHVMSALADGADQLAADAAEALSLPLVAVAPMPWPVYRDTIAARDRFDHHWTRAVLTFELPLIGDAAAPDFAEVHYEQLGALLSRRSHLLLALWDGLAIDKRGGTSAVIQMRRDGEYGVAGFRDSPLFAGMHSRLDLSSGGPVLQIVAPRTAAADGKFAAHPHDAKPGDCLILRRTAESGGDDASAIIAPRDVVAGLRQSVRDDFTQIVELNRIITGFSRPNRRVFAEQLQYLRVDGVADPDGLAADLTSRLRQWQAAADTAAQHYQRRLMGQFVPARTFRDMMLNGWKATKRMGRPPFIGVLFGFTAAVPIAVLMFEGYSHLGRKPWMLLAYLLVLLFTAAFYYFVVRRHQLQNRFQDYRALAEAMRVQLFWSVAAIPAAVQDDYLRKQSGELGWIQFALRGPALWATALALQLKAPRRELVERGWIDDQLNFFGPPGSKAGKAGLHDRAAARSAMWARTFLYLGLAMSGLLLAIEILKLVMGIPALQSDGRWPALQQAQNWLLVIAATSAAVAAFFTVSSDLRAYEAHAHSYALMGRIFAHAKRLAHGADDAEFQALVRELGHEALSESAEWLLDHRSRPIQHQ